MYNQNSNIEIIYGNNSLKEIYNGILKKEFIKLLNKEERKVKKDDKTI